MTVEDEKPELRRLARARRRAVVDAHVRAVAAAEALLADVRFTPPDVAAVYVAAGSEIDPGPLADHLRACGSAIALPVVVAPDAPLVFRRATGGGADLAPDLVVAPLLAFDARGGRLGQGGGHYDRTLAVLREGGRTFALGLAFAAQEIDEVPQGPYDQRLDGVLTERGLRLFAPARGA